MVTQHLITRGSSKGLLDHGVHEVSSLDYRAAHCHYVRIRSISHASGRGASRHLWLSCLGQNSVPLKAQTRGTSTDMFLVRLSSADGFFGEIPEGCPGGARTTRQQLLWKGAQQGARFFVLGCTFFRVRLTSGFLPSVLVAEVTVADLDFVHAML